MNSFIAKNKFILVLAALVICLSTAYGLTVKLDPMAHAATQQDTSATDYSWTTMSQAAAQYLGQTTAPDGTHGREVEVPSVATGFTGNFLGYMSPNSIGSRYTVGSLESANTVSYAYGTLARLDESFEVNGTEWADAAKVYAGYGYALTESGIDEPVIIGQTADDKRNIIGPIVLIVFLLCMALPKFFELVLTFLSVANPFKLFLGSGSVLYSIVPSISANAEFDVGSSSAVRSAMATALTSLADTVTGLYNVLYRLSFFAVIPIMIGVALFSWLVLRQKTGTVFKKLITRIVFIGLGVPLLLACYTAAIDSVKDFTINTSTGTPISVISVTFCDYGAWALGAEGGSCVGVALPAGALLEVDQSDTEEWHYNNNASTSDRKLVALINDQASNHVLNGGTGLSSSMSATDMANDDIYLMQSVAGGASEDKTQAVINLLQRYTKGEYITAANYATKVNNRFNRKGISDRRAYMNGFNLSNDWKDFDPSKAVAFKYESNDGTSFAVDVDEATAKAFARERMKVNGVNPAGLANLCRTGINSGFTPGHYAGNASSSRDFSPFPSMAIYNLLSSTFSDTAVTAYSTAATSTNQVQLAHYSVSIAGKGYLELAYVFDAVAIMACLMVLGYGYGFALLFACFKALIQIFPKVLTGMVGSIRGIAGSIVLVAALIIEILGTCIMYALGSLFIGSIYQLIEQPIATLLGAGLLNLPAQAAALVTVVASTVIIFKLTQTLLTYRTAVVKSISEAATSFVNKFLETNVTSPNLEGMDGRTVAGAALGAGMLLASTPAGNKLADRATEGLSDKMTNLDGEKIASGAMAGSTRTGENGEKYSSAEAKKAALGNTEGTTGGAFVDEGPSGSIPASDDGHVETPQTKDGKAADYVAANEDDFEKSIGYDGKLKYAENSPNYGEDEDEANKSGLADDSENLKNQDPFMASHGTGTVEDGEGSHEYKDGRLVADYDKDGNLVAKYDQDGKKITDNSERELTGTQTLDVSGTTHAEPNELSKGDVSTDKSKNATDNSTTELSGSKMLMTDASGNQQEVQIVNAQTGKPYTQADKDAGANYDVIGSNGRSVYPHVEGGMSANTLAMANGEPAMMVGPGSNGTSPYGGGTVYQLAPAPTPAPATVDVGAAVPQPAAPGATPQANQPVTQNTTQNIVQTNNDNTSTSHVQNTTQNTSESVMQNVTQGGGESGASMAGSPIIVGSQESAATVIQQGNNTTPNVNVSVSERGASTPAQTTVQQDFVQNITQTGNGGGYAQVPVSPSGGSTVINNTYNTQHTTQNTENTTNMTNNNVMNESGSARVGLGTGSIPNGPSRRA